MKIDRFTFASLAAAIATLQRLRAPMLLIRVAPLPAESVVIAVNGAAAAWPETPAPGECPDCRRDRHITADVELDYLYFSSLPVAAPGRCCRSDGGRLYELRIMRVTMAGDGAVYGFV